MAKAPTTTYGNDSISMLKGAERVRKRPSVIFGSDGLEGCEHAVFEILSNAIDEAREFGRDHSTVIHALNKVEKLLQDSTSGIQDNIRDITANVNSKL